MTYSNYIIILFLGLFAHLASAVDNPLYLSLDRADGVYEVGSKALLTISVDALPELEPGEWEGVLLIQEDFEKMRKPIQWNPLDLKYDVPLEFSGAGQLIVTVIVKRKSDPNTKFEKSIGALFGPELVELSTNEAADFDAFWQQQRDDFASRITDVEMTEVDSSDDTVVIREVMISVEGRGPITGYLAMPRGAKPATLPAAISYHGAGVRSSSLYQVLIYAKLGYLAMDINAHGIPNGKDQDFYTELSKSELKTYRFEGLESPEHWYFKDMFLRALSAADFLVGQAEWNGVDLLVFGSSQGGAQALAVAGLDSRVSAIALNVPAMCDLDGDRVGRRGSWPRSPSFGQSHGFDEAAIMETLGYYDGGLFAKRTKAKAMVTIGLIDRTCPALGIQAMANNLAGEVTVVSYPEMAHAIPSEVRARLNQFLDDSIAK